MVTLIALMLVLIFDKSDEYDIFFLGTIIIDCELIKYFLK